MGRKMEQGKEDWECFGWREGFRFQFKAGWFVWSSLSK